ncbi:MAG: putative addiction module antidote protein [Parcubacteria group bacterium]|nr:putative addiction module antidote protein [Parcubacteria group bacterium]
MRTYRRFKDYHLEKLKNSTEAQAYLKLALADYEKDLDIEEFLLAIRDVAAARGGFGNLAEQTRLNRQNLYKALSTEGNPRLATVGSILHALGFRLSVERLAEPDPASARR